MNEPICQICKEKGRGVAFPMTPKTTGFRFGEICADCDERDDE